MLAKRLSTIGENEASTFSNCESATDRQSTSKGQFIRLRSVKARKKREEQQVLATTSLGDLIK